MQQKQTKTKTWLDLLPAQTSVVVVMLATCVLASFIVVVLVLYTTYGSPSPRSILISTS